MLGNKGIMGDNIQFYMDERGINRKDFAKALGVPYSSLTDWLNGKTYPRIDKIQKMADYFGIEKADLVEKRIVQKKEATSFSEFDHALVNAYHAASEERQAIIRDMLHLNEDSKAKIG